MKVLVLTHPEADFLAWAVYDGLCSVLGPENVVEFPWKASYHGETDRYPSMYQHHTPELKGIRWEESAEGPQGLTGPFEWAKSWPGAPRSREEIRAMLEAKTFDIAICESPRATVIKTLKQFKDALSPRRVLVDGEDYSEIDVAGIVPRFGVGLYLKRELLTARSQIGPDSACWMKPFSLAATIPPPEAPVEIATTDVMCAMGLTHPNRAPVKQLVETLRAESFRVDTEQRSWRQYIEATRRSRIAIAPRGFGQDTLRRWEIPCAGGALLFAERLSLHESHPLQDGQHCVLYDNVVDLGEKLRCWLADEPRRLAVAAAGHAFVQEHHTNAARARQLLDLCCKRWGEPQ